MDRNYGHGSVWQDPRNGIWNIVYYSGGVRRTESAKSRNEEDAVRLLRNRIKVAGTKTGPVNADKVKFEQLEELIQQDYRRQERQSTGRMQNGFDDLRHTFRGHSASQITTKALGTHFDKRRGDGRAAASIKTDFAYLKHAFNLAIDDGLLERKPKFPKIDVRNVRQGFFEREQFDKVYAELPDTLRPIAVMAYYTGWRVKDEILPLTWDRVDLRAGIIRLDPNTTKNKEGRTWPFDKVPEFARALQDRRAETDLLEKQRGVVIPWVFHRNGRQVKSIRVAWENACVRAKVERYQHDFRRTAARNLMRAGVPQPVAKKLIGHKTDEMYERYAIVAEGDLRESTVKLAALNAGLTAPTTTDASPPR